MELEAVDIVVTGQYRHVVELALDAVVLTPAENFAPPGSSMTALSLLALGKALGSSAMNSSPFSVKRVRSVALPSALIHCADMLKSVRSTVHTAD